MKISDEYKNYSVIDSFYTERPLKNKVKIEGYQFVRFGNGEFGVVTSSVYIRPEGEGQNASRYVDIFEKGKETNIKDTFEYLKRRHLHQTVEKKDLMKAIELKDGQQITASIEDIKVNKDNGTAEVKLDSDKKKLVLQVKQEYAQHLKAGQQIAIVRKQEGIKINVLRQHTLSLTRSIE